MAEEFEEFGFGNEPAPQPEGDTGYEDFPFEVGEEPNEGQPEADPEGQQEAPEGAEGNEGETEEIDPEIVSRENQYLKQQLEFFQSMAAQQVQPQPQHQQPQPYQPQPPYQQPYPQQGMMPDDPYAPITAQDANQYLGNFMQQQVAPQIQQVEKRVRQAMGYMSEQAAKSRYNDYDEAIGLAAEMLNQNPVYGQMIANAQDPAEAAYRLGRSHPKYFEQAVAKERKKVAEKIQSNSEKPTMPRKKGTPAQRKTAADAVWNASEETFDKWLRETKGLD